MMKQIGHWKIVVLLLAAMSVNVRVSAQNVRFDYIALTTTGSGQAVPLLALPGTGVTFFSCTAGVCTTLANTFPSASSTTACPTNAQVVLALSSQCVSTADIQGNFGAWFQAGQYAYTLLINGTSYGPYPFTVGGSGGGGSGTVGSGTAGQVAQYPANGTAVGGATVSGDATIAAGGALTLKTVNGNVGTCGDATHVGVPTLNAKGLTTACSPVAINFPASGVTLQTNGTNNTSQSVLNLSGGAGTTITNPSAGNVFITSTGATGTAGGDLSGTYPNPTVAQVNGAVVPASAPALASNASHQLILATNVPLLNAANTFTALNQFSTQMNVSNAIATGLFVTPTNMSGQSAGSTTFQLDLGTGIAAFGISAGGQSTFNITPNGTVGGKNAGTQEWSISNVNGSSQWGPTTGTSFNIAAGGANINGQNNTVLQWQITNATGAAAFKSLSATSTIVNGAGLQIASGPGCTASAGTVLTECVATITLPVVEPDALYSVLGCEIQSNTVGALMGNIASPTTTNFQIGVFSATTSGTSGGTIVCLVVHN